MMLDFTNYPVQWHVTCKRVGRAERLWRASKDVWQIIASTPSEHKVSLLLDLLFLIYPQSPFHKKRPRSTYPRSSNTMPSASSNSRCSTALYSLLIRPAALITRHHGT